MLKIEVRKPAPFGQALKQNAAITSWLITTISDSLYDPRTQVNKLQAQTLG